MGFFLKLEMFSYDLASRPWMKKGTSISPTLGGRVANNPPGGSVISTLNVSVSVSVECIVKIRGSIFLLNSFGQLLDIPYIVTKWLPLRKSSYSVI